MTIGELLTELKDDFPAVTASKIRFLEEKGLITPQRTAAGYRKYTGADADRLRFILAIQRDEHKPLSVIKEYLDAIDRGEQPQPLSSGMSLGPKVVTEQLAHEIIGRIRPLTRAELQGITNASDELLEDLHNFSLLRMTDDQRYDEHAQRVVKAAVILASHGIDPRHLRSFKITADRELGLVERAVAPMAARKDAAARARVAETAREISEACLSIHAALVQGAISDYE
ncbi:transcriptional regulator FtsR [Micrococcoides hystricis]|uniref:MerR family transcriptional regulator n=1 Tax=Micrococcoides hystricis TaxID=1572761 RepID=A0ABV6P7J3_9MICC